VKISCRFQQPEKLKRYKQIPKKVESELKKAVAVATRQTSYNAKSFAPHDKRKVKYKKTGGRLRTDIHPKITDKGLTGEVIVGPHYGPYVEFGTGGLVRVPAELKEYAMQFKGAGIRKVNTGAQPYLYPAFFINREKFTKECDRILKRAI